MCIRHELFQLNMLVGGLRGEAVGCESGRTQDTLEGPSLLWVISPASFLVEGAPVEGPRAGTPRPAVAGGLLGPPGTGDGSPGFCHRPVG